MRREKHRRARRGSLSSETSAAKLRIARRRQHSGNQEITLARSTHTHDEIIKLVSALPLDFAPGAQWRYSNTGYYLLGMIIEKVTGKKYDDYLDERILKPLGMSVTRNGDPLAVIPHRSCGYLWDGKYENGPALQPSAAFAAGELVSTVADLAKYEFRMKTGRKRHAILMHRTK